VVVGFYGVLSRQRLDAPFEDVRSGLFVAFAEWAAKKVAEMPTRQERAWKPNLLIPVEDTSRLRGSFEFIQNITYPKGSVKLIGVRTPESPDGLVDNLQKLHQAFRDRGVFASATVVDNKSFGESLSVGMQVLQGAFFRPNIVFLPMSSSEDREREYRDIVRQAKSLKLGTLLYAPHPVAGLGQRQSVNVWIRDRSPDWNLRWDIGNLDLPILIAYKLKRNWKAHLRILTVIEDEREEKNAREFMSRLMDLARLPETEVIVARGDFKEYLSAGPQADLNIFGLLTDPNFDFIREMVDRTRASCLFVRDSGQESALA
ncbi:MAG: Na-K-Cl cotransporter, partial [Rhodothermia bacterium]|nr:Na-K-Cl cotransporter [Rhodothermia bacterium]